MSTLRNKALARRFYDEIFNNHKIYLMDELVSEGFIDRNPDPGQEPGIAGVRKMFSAMLNAFPDLSVRIEAIVAEGDRVAAQVVMSGTHLGEASGIPASGRRVTVSGFDQVRFKDGRIAERWGVFDMAGMLAQIGAVPGPSSDDVKKLSRRYYERLDATKADIASMRDELFHDLHTTHFVGEAQPLGPEALQGFLKVFWNAFPDIAHEIKSQTCEGGMVVNQMRLAATHKGEFAGVAATNKKIEIDVFARQVWKDGKLYEQWITPDILALLQQIGAIPQK
jgi:steroid delta-isomerase-like uncharacterized protein